MALIDDKPQPLYRVMRSRKNYRILSRTSRLMGEQPNIDLTSRAKRLYMKVDTNNDAILPLPNLNTKQFLGLDIFGLGFLVDACNDFMGEYNSRIVAQPDAAIANLGSLRIIKSNKPYEEVLYERRRIAADYVTSYYARIHHDSIDGFEDFVKVFMRWAKDNAVDDPVTNTGMVLAHSVPNSISGLTVVFGNYNENNDDLRGTIVADPNFHIYSNMAAKYGFYITKNSPWRLIANVESPIMQSYIDNYVIESYNSLDDFFGDFYIKAHRLDLRDFKSFLLASYNTFVHHNPIIKKSQVRSNGTLRVLKKRRSKVTLEMLEEIYKPWWWISKLYDVRCFESDMPEKTKNQKQRIYSNIENTFKTKGTIGTLDYINNLIKERS